MIVLITKLSYYELDFLVPKTGLILKTMIFVNKINNAVKIATYFCLLLPLEDQDQEEVLIQLFYSCYEASTYANWMEDFRNKEIKILVCTNAAKMGVNIPNITRMIHEWK